MAIGIFLLTIHSALADCGNLATVDAGELIALPDRAIHALPPEVNCTSEDLDPRPALCDTRVVIDETRMLDPEHRLVVTHLSRQPTSSGPGKRPWKRVDIFACVDGQAKGVFIDTLHADGRLESIAPGKFLFVDSYPNGTQLNQIRRIYYWHEKSQTYTTDPVLDPAAPERQTIACNNLETADATRLIALSTDSHLSHGFGIYDGGEWDVSLKMDRMIDGNQRLIQVRRNHLKGSGAPDVVMVFACVSGRVANVFNLDFGPYGVSIREAANGQLIISMGFYPSDSQQKIGTYTWRPALGRYILTGVHFVPLRSESPRPVHGDPPGAVNARAYAHLP